MEIRSDMSRRAWLALIDMGRGFIASYGSFAVQGPLFIQPRRLKPRDIILKISGGAGVGSPAERDPEKVRNDMMNEFRSVKKTHALYKVALDPKTFAIDAREPARLRGEGAPV